MCFVQLRVFTMKKWRIMLREKMVPILGKKWNAYWFGPERKSCFGHINFRSSSPIGPECLGVSSQIYWGRDQFCLSCIKFYFKNVLLSKLQTQDDSKQDIPLPKTYRIREMCYLIKKCIFYIICLLNCPVFWYLLYWFCDIYINFWYNETPEL